MHLPQSCSKPEPKGWALPPTLETGCLNPVTGFKEGHKVPSPSRRTTATIFTFHDLLWNEATSSSPLESFLTNWDAHKHHGGICPKPNHELFTVQFQAPAFLVFHRRNETLPGPVPELGATVFTRHVVRAVDWQD